MTGLKTCVCAGRKRSQGSFTSLKDIRVAIFFRENRVPVKQVVQDAEVNIILQVNSQRLGEEIEAVVHWRKVVVGCQDIASRCIVHRRG
jgi:hypothetical protein